MESIQILLASTNAIQVQEIRQRLRAAWPNSPIELSLVEDGHRALSDFKNSLHHLVICDENLPGLGGSLLASEIGKISGSTSVLRLVPNAKKSSGEIIATPILNWTEFLSIIQQSLPDEVKARFGLFERDSILVDHLLSYGKKYRTADEQSQRQKSFFLFPDWGSDHQLQTVNVNSKTEATSQQFEFLLPPLTRVGQLQELAILLGLFFIAGVVWIYQPQGEWFTLTALRWVLASFASVALLGYFVSRALRLTASRAVKKG